MARILVATLADAVDGNPGQKFNVLGGGIDVFGTQSLPVTITRLSLLFAVALDEGELTETKVNAVFKGTDGKEFMRVDLGLSPRDPGAKAAVVWAGINLPPITTKTAGRMAIEVSTGDSSYNFGLEIRGPATPIFPTPVGSSTN